MRFGASALAISGATRRCSTPPWCSFSICQVSAITLRSTLLSDRKSPVFFEKSMTALEGTARVSARPKAGDGGTFAPSSILRSGPSSQSWTAAPPWHRGLASHGPHSEPPQWCRICCQGSRDGRPATAEACHVTIASWAEDVVRTHNPLLLSNTLMSGPASTTSTRFVAASAKGETSSFTAGFASSEVDLAAI